ncbi:MAG TPA: hypothetical protein VH988_07765 [Thermoanaerobaculia bacterium]|jgi:hypothetical protein|nr:hypothetical protein [Thermoanaerobaculia bacterium]
MPTVYVIHCAQDLEFIEETLLQSLPCNGFDRWISSDDMRASRAASAVNTRVMAECRAILAVVSRAAAQVPEVRDEAAGALACKTPVVVVLAGAIDAGDRARFPPGLWSLPRVDFTAGVPAAQSELADLLPPAEPVTEASELGSMARTIEWNETIFSAALAEIVERHDHNRAQVLIDTLARHAMHQTNPYPPKPANTDLTVLRSSRQFKLMRRYAEAVLASGTTDAKVRRQYGQSLIEQKEFAGALQVLRSIVEDSASRRAKWWRRKA